MTHEEAQRIARTYFDPRDESFAKCVGAILASHPATRSAEELIWAVERWNLEVRNRPMVNVHRRTLDETWRQVIRHFGGDPDVLLDASSEAEREE